jgi:hypothetical protein
MFRDHMRERLHHSLVNYWPLDEASGSGVRRAALGNTPASDLVANGSPASGTGPNANIPLATVFTRASSQRLVSAVSFNYSVPRNPWHMVAWANIASEPAGGFPTVIAARDGSNNGAIMYYTQASDRWTYQFGSIAVNAGAVVAVGTWSYLDAYTDGTRNYFRVNVGTEGSSALSTITFPGSGSFMVSSSQIAGGQHFDGSLAAVHLFRRRLNRSELDYLYNAGLGRDLRAA